MGKPTDRTGEAVKEPSTAPHEGSALLLDAAERSGEWLRVPLGPGAGAAGLQAGQHPHEARLRLLELNLFPAKWLGLLLSTGGIRWSSDGRTGEAPELLELRAFPELDSSASAELRRARERLDAWGGHYPDSWPQPLYEDEWCLVLDKPAGLPVHGSGDAPPTAIRGGSGTDGRPAHSRGPGRTGGRSVRSAGPEDGAGMPQTLDEAALCRCLSQGDPLPVRHIHRLDDDTSGPVLYAKNDLAQQTLDAAMREKAIRRVYGAVASGVPRRREGVVDAPIGRDRHHGARRRVSPGGDHALTRYKVLEAFGSEASLLQLELDTGRTHQIRVHMSHIGHPLLGDALYGVASPLLGRQALHGRRLEFRHPWSGRELAVEAPLPADLEMLLQRLRRDAGR
ncbi:RluA family pseudouridine synthase [Paenibacillus albicereus]|uniref:RluA family pseudouridine synthase n=1 Tax=Paenibacillus albicereus TaxID=2726185 RepID=UPI002E2B3641|nr:RluA family pseudouridine synthase [Paenibacillus albicereus]